MLHQLTAIIKRSPPAALLLLLLLILVFSLFGALQLQGLSQWMGLEMTKVMEFFAEENTLHTRNYLRWSAIINQVFTFLLPALAFAYLAHQRNWIDFLKLSKAPLLRNITLGVLLLLFFMSIFF